jgi:hypothetical protein
MTGEMAVRRDALRTSPGNMMYPTRMSDSIDTSRPVRPAMWLSALSLDRHAVHLDFAGNIDALVASDDLGPC